MEVKALSKERHVIENDVDPNSDLDVVLVEPGPVETRFGKTALGTNGDFERSDGYDWFEETSNERTV